METRAFRVCVIGGDERQRVVAERLAAAGRTVHHWGLGPSFEIARAQGFREWQDAVRGTEVMIFPLPCSEDGVWIRTPLETEARVRMTAALEHFCGRMLIGGRLPESIKAAAEARAIGTCELLEEERLQMFNAIPTVEGALSIALRELPYTLWGSRVAVIGCGRIGTLLAERLHVLGAQVTVYARKERDRLYARVRGMEAEPLSVGTEGAEGILFPGSCRVIFNTVPQRVFSEEVLRTLPPDVLVIDLASAPGGVDHAAAARTARHVIWATALPGRMFPKSAGEILASTLEELLREGELLC